uniref:NADH-ubiquinone oxidoreductase chain 4L n=1 Tax=Succinea erythrophana TaxID=3003847 RepID=A0A9E9ERJ5_9EUPU|nr:NADH dehydrogenase subunit 4L [Succinea erythrophana]WAO26022.1 NADH dehydrogenase subunit 4L [Succinea erythrophana]
MNFYEFLLLLMVAFSIFLLLNKYHIIMCLLILESLMVLVLGYVFFSSLNIYEDLFIFIMILCLSACESALGLSLLISIIRCFGSDYMKNLD